MTVAAVNQKATARVKTRATILIASPNGLFLDVIGAMVTDAGFMPAHQLGLEEASLQLTRTQPCIVICDCDGPPVPLQRFIDDVSARGIPLLLLTRKENAACARALNVPPRQTWLSFPVKEKTFRAALDGLAPSARHTTGRTPSIGQTMNT
jgi:hypothetical protein